MKTKDKATIPDVYLLFTTSRHGGFSGFKYMVSTLEEAQRFCSDDRTAKPQWMFCYTHLRYVVEETADNYKLKISDNGMFDELLEQLGIVVLSQDEIAEICADAKIPFKRAA